MGEKTHNANEYEFRTDDVDGAIKTLKEAGIKISQQLTKQEL